MVDFSSSLMLGVGATTMGVCGRRLRVLLLLFWAPAPVLMVRVGEPLCTRTVSRCLGVLLGGSFFWCTGGLVLVGGVGGDDGCGVGGDNCVGVLLL